MCRFKLQKKMLGFCICKCGDEAFLDLGEGFMEMLSFFEIQWLSLEGGQGGKVFPDRGRHYKVQKSTMLTH